MIRLSYLIPMFVLAGCTGSPPVARHTLVADSRIMTADGTPMGMARLSATPAGQVTLSIDLSGLPAGARHGMHLHAVGKCDAPGFVSAGPHLNPNTRQHGTDNPSGSHLGDLPNLSIKADGTASAELQLSGQASELMPLLFDADGTALVIHAGPDDYRTDPSGNSGARIGCGVLVRMPG